jgi:hypothetical protein
MDAVEVYLKQVGEIHASGAAVAETSYYPALQNLLNEIGADLKPRVRCIVNPANRGAGIPDIGLYTADQFKHAADLESLAGQMPSRGVLEAKPPSKDVAEIAATEQVNKYYAKYGVVIVTNLREFLLVGRGNHGEATQLDSFCIAADEGSFWLCTTHHVKTAKDIGARLREFLVRVMLLNAPLSEPEDLAWFLASYARDAKANVEKTELPALSEVRSALEETLGMKFTGPKGEHFFRSTLVQTIFYGIFSAWVLWCRSGIPDSQVANFDWKQAQWIINVPFIHTLFENLMMPGRLKPLGLVEILDRANSVLNRVDRTVFFGKFQEEHAVQYFYEPFLEAFDPELRKDLGVWYTPREIVQYQVARVDAVLRKEMGLADGLADPSVLVLDPCCGTGTYLIEVLAHIASTLNAKGGGALVAAEIKKAAMTKVFGFEILPAPFVVSHLQLGLLLQRLGSPLKNASNERAAVFLTNSLTGWEPHKESKPIPFPELAQEHAEAEKVKQSSKIIVVLGNPPYNAFAGVSPEEELGLVDPYKKGLNRPVSEEGGWGIKKFNLDDLYVRFYRLAERKITEMSGKGVVSFISNFSYLSDPSFVVMRKRFLDEFDLLWFDCMNGDSRETGKLTPTGAPDPSVFSTEYNREGIRVGTAVCVMVRKESREKPATVRFRQYWGVTKREDLLHSLKHTPFDELYELGNPNDKNRYSFRPENVSSAYMTWPKLTELCGAAPSNGLMEKRGGALISIDREPLEKRMRDYFDPDLTWEEYGARHRELTAEQARFNPELARKKVISKEQYNPARILKYAIRPLETRWCYYTGIRPVWNEPRPALWEQSFPGNAFLMSRPSGVSNPEGVPLYFTTLLGDNDFQRGHSYYIPFRLAPKGYKDDIERQQGNTVHMPLKANLSAAARRYLSAMGMDDPDTDENLDALVWLHSLAIGYSPAYLDENADGIRSDWPRLPLPSNKKLLLESASLGRHVAELLDTESQAIGVTGGDMEPVLLLTGVVQRVGGGQLDPNSGDLDVTAGWGHAGKDGVTMPARGTMRERPFTTEEKAAIAAAAESRGIDAEKAAALVGPDTRDVYLNEHAFWKNVPASAWEFYIGGYQVIKKWLSYRERDLLGRAMKVEEVIEVTAMVRRLTALVLLRPTLDENYRKVKGSPFAWEQGASVT